MVLYESKTMLSVWKEKEVQLRTWIFNEEIRILMGFTKFDYITPVKFKPRVEGWNDIEKLKAYNVDEDFRFFPPNSKEAIRRSIAIRIRELELEK